MAAIRALSDAGLTGKGLIALFLTQGVPPLMHRALRFWEMTADKAPFVGTVTVPSKDPLHEVEGLIRFLTLG